MAVWAMVPVSAVCGGEQIAGGDGDTDTGGESQGDTTSEGDATSDGAEPALSQGLRLIVPRVINETVPSAWDEKTPPLMARFDVVEFVDGAVSRAPLTEAIEVAVEFHNSNTTGHSWRAVFPGAQASPQGTIALEGPSGISVEDADTAIRTYDASARVSGAIPVLRSIARTEVEGWRSLTAMPVGESLVVTGSRTEPPGRRIWTTSLEDSEPLVVLVEENARLQASLGSATLVYQGGQGLFVTDAVSGTRARIDDPSGAEVGRWSMSEDGSTVVFSQVIPAGDAEGMFVATLSAGAVESVVELETGMADELEGLRVSPSGDLLWGTVESEEGTTGIFAHGLHGSPPLEGSSSALERFSFGQWSPFSGVLLLRDYADNSVAAYDAQADSAMDIGAFSVSEGWEFCGPGLLVTEGSTEFGVPGRGLAWFDTGGQRWPIAAETEAWSCSTEQGIVAYATDEGVFARSFETGLLGDEEFAAKPDDPQDVLSLVVSVDESTIAWLECPAGASRPEGYCEGVMRAWNRHSLESVVLFDEHHFEGSSEHVRALPVPSADG